MAAETREVGPQAATTGLSETAVTKITAETVAGSTAGEAMVAAAVVAVVVAETRCKRIL